METVEKKKNSHFQTFLDGVKFPLVAILLSFVIGSFFIIWTGNSPLVAYGALFEGSLGSFSKLGETLLKTTPLIFTGLSVAFAFRTGLFNIGAEGQYVVGTLFTVAAAWIFRDLPGFVLIPAILISGALGGALWAMIPGLLKAKLGIHEVIVTIMLNHIGLFFTNFFIRTALNPSELLGTAKKAHSVLIPEHAKLTHFSDVLPFFGTSSVNTGFLIAVVAAVVAWYVLFKTTLGYEIRSVGNNPFAAEYGGINTSKNMILAFAISGIMAGLAAATMVAGLTYKIDQAPHSPGYGFTGIAVALVGKNHPIGVLASAFLFGILSNGARKMQIAGIPKEIVDIIQGLIIIFIAAEAILKYIPNLKKKQTSKKTGEVA